VAELETIHAEYLNALSDAKSAVRDIEAELALVERAMAGKAASTGVRPVSTRPANGRGPSRGSLRNQILKVVRELDGIDRKQLLPELERRGLAPRGKNPRNTVNSRVLEMVVRGELRRDDDDFLLLPNEEEVPIA
jgi:hypothetical protein